MDKGLLQSLIKKYPAKTLPNGMLRTGPARLSYPHLFKKTEGDGEFKPVFDSTFLFPIGADLSLFEKAALTAAKEKFGPKVTQAQLRWPIHDQDKKSDKDGYVVGAFYFRATSDRKPGVIRIDGREMTEDDLYPGCWVVATVNAFAFDNKGKGASYGLQNVVKIADDESFGAARTDAREDFADMLDGNDDAGAYFNEGSGEGESVSDLV